MIKNLFQDFHERLKPQELMLDKGETLFNQGEGVNNFYFIQKGKIKLIRNTSDGSPVILHIGHHGESIAEASLFSNQYHCSAIVDSDTELSYVKKQDLLQLLAENPKAMLSFLAVFSGQVRDLRAINEIKNIRSAKERILTFIKSNANADHEFKLNLSLKDIAYKIGLAHETFYRELKSLEQAGELSRNSDRIKLLRKS